MMYDLDIGQAKQVFVFGSNLAGRHGKGAAAYAAKYHGARYGIGYGLCGSSYALPTKDASIQTLPLHRIAEYVKTFIAFAIEHQEMQFQVTRVGCGLAGYKDNEVAPLFKLAPSNCYFDRFWKLYLGDKHKYWS